MSEEEKINKNTTTTPKLLPDFLSSQRYLAMGLVGGTILLFTYLLTNIKKASYGYKCNQVLDDKEDGVVYRSKMLKSKDKLTDHFMTVFGNKITNLHDNFEYVAKNYPNRIYVVEKIRQIEVKKAYHEIAELRNHLGSGMMHLGMKSQSIVGAFTRKGINSTIIKHAAEAYSLIYVPIPNDQEYTEKIISETNISMLFVDDEEKLEKIYKIVSEQKKMEKKDINSEQKKNDIEQNKNDTEENKNDSEKIIGDKKATLEIIISDFDCDEQKMKVFVQDFSDLSVRLVDWKEVMEMGRNNVSPHVVPLPDYVATIIHQNPFNKKFQPIKISHKNIISFSGGLKKNGVGFLKDEKYLDYLGDNNYLNLALKNYVISSTSQIGFYDGNSNDLPKEIKEFRPTVLISPPQFISDTCKEIDTKVSKLGKFSGFFYAVTFLTKKIFMERKFQNIQPFFDVLAFSSIKISLGDFRHVFVEERVGREDCDKFRICFSGNIYHVLGSMVMSLPHDYTENNFGVPLSNVEAIIKNEDEQGEGDLYLRGPGVLVGLLDENKDDWYSSGFRGKFNGDGNFLVSNI